MEIVDLVRRRGILTEFMETVENAVLDLVSKKYVSEPGVNALMIDAYANALFRVVEVSNGSVPDILDRIKSRYLESRSAGEGSRS